MSMHKLRSYLGSGATLLSLSEQVGRLLDLQRAWESALPAALAQACTVGSLRDRTLVVYATNGAVAAKIRQLIPSLLEKFHEKGPEVTAILLRVQAPQTRRGPPQANSRHLSPAAAASLHGLAEGLLASSPLRQAVERLLDRHAEAPAARGRE